MLGATARPLAQSFLLRGGYAERATQCDITLEGVLLSSDGVRLDSTGDMRVANRLKTHSGGSGCIKVALAHNALLSIESQTCSHNSIRLFGFD